MRYWLVSALCLGLVSTPAAAQRNEATIEASVLRGALGYARTASPRTFIGVEIGFGFPQIDRTLKPAKDAASGEPDFEEYLHVGLFVRVKASEHVEIDTGLRGSVADLWACTASDCWPALFGGGYIQPMIGWRRLKVGMRLTAGVIGEHEEGTPESNTSLVSLNPFVLRATFPW